MDQISEHQRDLTNSASQRFIADYVAGFCQAVSRMTEVVAGLGVNRPKMLANLRGPGFGAVEPDSAGGVRGGVLAEPAYILLAESGETDAHETIRRITLEAETKELSFADALALHPETMALIAGQMVELGLVATKQDAASFFAKPELYRGLSAEKARRLAEKYNALMGIVLREGARVE
jgi:adenylosuccinate lyase